MSNQAKAIESAATAVTTYIASLEARIVEARTYIHEQGIALEFLQAFPEAYAPPAEEWSYGMMPASKTTVALALDPSTVHALMINRDIARLADLVEPLKWLTARLGAYKIDDYPELGRRSYSFSKGRLRFQCFLGRGIGDEAVCKFVQVGVKEEPVYKLMCGDEPIQDQQQQDQQEQPA